MIKDFIHPTLGNITVILRPTARHIIMRIKSGGIQVTVPPALSKKELLETLAKHEAPLLKKLTRKPARQFDCRFTTESDLFGFRIELYDRAVFRVTLKESRLVIYCPQETDFGQPDTQRLLSNAVLKALKYEAKRVLPSRVFLLAERHQIKVADVKVNSSAGRWGSCSNRRNINLSCFCLLLPEHLLDYIILHELAHTFEMNHSERFYHKLDQLCGGNNSLFRQELKQATSPLLELLREYK